MSISEWIGIGQLIAAFGILIVLAQAVKRMGEASDQRNKQLDRMEEQSKALVDGLKQQTAALEKLLARS